MDNIADTRFALIALPQVPVPALLSLMLGYDLTRGNRRYIGVAKSFARTTVSVTDGDEIYDCLAEGWDTYRSHPAVAPVLSTFDFGDTSGIPRHMFVIDRLQHRAFAGSVEAATCFLDRQDRQPLRSAASRSKQALLGNISTSLRLSNTDVYTASLNATVQILLPDLCMALDMARHA
jgi:hypothetical protein